MDENRRILRDTSIAIEEDRISFIGPPREMHAQLRSEFDTVIDARDMLILPGFVDTHIHLQEHLTRGIIPPKAIMLIAVRALRSACSRIALSCSGVGGARSRI